MFNIKRAPELSDEQLIETLIETVQATARYRQVRPSFKDQITINYLKGLVHARIDSAGPPVRIGDTVAPTTDAPITNAVGITLSGSGPYEVAYVWYEGNGEWSLSFTGDNWGPFDANLFEKIEEPAAASA